MKRSKLSSTYLIPTSRGVCVIEDPPPPYIQKPGVPPFFRTLHEQSVRDSGNPLVRYLNIREINNGYERCREAVEALAAKGQDERPVHEFLDGPEWLPGQARFISAVVCGDDVVVGYAFFFTHWPESGKRGAGTVFTGPPPAEAFIRQCVECCHAQYRAAFNLST